jgi:Tol biopolymer transport system component
MRQLTTSPGADGFPAAAPDNRHVVFISDREGGLRVWRMDADGSRQTPLTSGPSDFFPMVSGDGSFVYFTPISEPDASVRQVPMGGGTPTGAFSPSASDGSDAVPRSFTPHQLSPDGKAILGSYFNDAQGRTRIAIVDPSGRRPARTLDVPVALGLVDSFAWAPDGRAITFPRTSDGVSNIWRQPLEGGSPARVTNFKGGDIIAIHAWSRDGKYLAMVRTATPRDVVVIRDVRR